jgi:mRNA interferase MazF
MPRPIGGRPVAVLTVNPLISRMSAVTVAVITRTEGPASTHLLVGGEAGLTGLQASYVNATDLHTIDKTRLHRRRGQLNPAELARLEDAIRCYLGL